MQFCVCVSSGNAGWAVGVIAFILSFIFCVGLPMLLIVCCLWLSYRTQVFSNTQANNSDTTVLAFPQTHAMFIVLAQQSPLQSVIAPWCQSQQPPHLLVPVPPDTEYKGAEFQFTRCPSSIRCCHELSITLSHSYYIHTCLLVCLLCLCDSPIKSNN